MNRVAPFALIVVLLAALSAGSASAEICEGYGPQTPRDIDDSRGENPVVFSLASPAAVMNLCNIHFHVQAEHRASDFSLTTEGESGYQCNATSELTPAELAPLAENHCEGVEPGDTIEVHWVHTSCTVEPGEGLGSCLSEACSNPELRVETQVFLVVNDRSAMDFGKLAYGGHRVDGYHQAKAIPDTTGDPVVFHGSTTGPSYTQEKCSPLQVTWSVRPQCAKLDVSSLSDWCAGNVFEENHAHGVRELVTDPRLLAPIR